MEKVQVNGLVRNVETWTRKKFTAVEVGKASTIPWLKYSLTC